MSNPLPTAFVSHQVPGRIRLRVPAMRHHEEYFARLREQMASIPGLLRLITNTRTASVLIEYAGDVPALEQVGSQHQLFQLESRPHPHALSEFLYAAMSQPDQILKKVSNGRVDASGVLALAFAGLGITQFVRGQGLPAGLTLLVNARDMIKQAGKPGDK